MRNLILVVFILFIPFGSFAQDNPKNDKEEPAMKPEKNDEGEWELTVIDTQFDYFLNAIARPVSQYSESSLKNRNRILVTEWNSYYMSGRYRNVIESMIDYDPREDYGIKFEYKLYQVFAYVSWKYKLRMNGLGAADSFR
ncbi:hypothetical protein CHRY9390_01216 [Chryseobacterium aquaeductus]|uniref:Uncharacterized protein n=1 Tax=Chryseobacterium aquaeductus TaxID=2675056 RepID=A0A9N8MFD8_9FLAO|nr:DUF6146 family protein [Chryseobacterium aquaeductus]CAA7330545.1 hypothetical protein CHRY9390_01216 [Chryseobacterium potabilaquae]CAD7804386.1 hypothetical protein CHRY9390_01216 [Chryseobacterium aquaeductus]